MKFFFYFQNEKYVVTLRKALTFSKLSVGFRIFETLLVYWTPNHIYWSNGIIQELKINIDSRIWIKILTELII